MKNDKPNKRLLEKIKLQIIAEPKQFIMRDYFESSDSIPNCGTAACIAGWACTLTKFKNPSKASEALSDKFYNGERLVWVRAKKALGLTEAQATNLFLQLHWPAQFRGGNRRSLAERAVKRIDHFLKTGE